MSRGEQSDVTSGSVRIRHYPVRVHGENNRGRSHRCSFGGRLIGHRSHHRGVIELCR